MRSRDLPPGTALLIATAVTAGWHVLVLVARLPGGYPSDALALGYAVLLVAPDPRANGVRLGRLRAHWKRVCVVCGLPVLATAVLLPVLGDVPWNRMSSSIWTVQPLAQELVFFGFVFRTFERTGMRRGAPLLLSALCFSLWHLPNLRFMPVGQVAVQLGYTFAGGCLTGLARQWTGSMLYGAVTHTAVNYLAWAAP